VFDFEEAFELNYPWEARIWWWGSGTRGWIRGPDSPGAVLGIRATRIVATL